MRKFTLGLALAATMPVVANAQRYLGVATSNWSGTNSLYLNPANLADSRHKFTIDLFSMNVGADNSLAKFNASDVFNGILDGDKLSTMLKDYSTKDKFSIVLPYAEVRGPGFMVAFGSKHGIALTTRVRGMAQFHNMSQNLYRNITDSNFYTNNVTVKADKFNFTAHAWSEIGLSYGGVIWQKNKHQIKGGLTGRYLMGIGAVSMVSNNLSATFTSASSTQAQFNVSNTDLSYAQAGASMKGGSDAFSDFFGTAGKGFGLDLGVTYEFRPKYQSYKYDMDGKTGISDNSKNQYLLRFSAAVTDIGSIKYSSNSSQAKFSGNANGLVGDDIEKHINDFDSLSTYLKNKGLNLNKNNDATKVGLPTMLVVGVDYHAIGGLYINATYMGNIADRMRYGNTNYSQVTLTPRFDTRVFSFGLPVTYSTLTQNIKVGAGVRVAGFFFGSDDMLSFMGDGNGMNMYFGAYVPFNKKKPRDSDGDLVSNRKDKCKNEKGVWEMRGCPNPDKDGDGILDKDDKCPDVAGSKTAAGCPDADLDGVADAEDRCPQEAGLPAMQGCPDRDNDGIADIDDACPDQQGLAQYKGCPDTDGDGIADNVDKCPNAAGPVANEGCPDTDNDGIADHMDKCPTVPGTVANQGCPEVSVQVKKRLAFAATAIQFDLGKATIKKSSNKLLDEVVKILNDYPDYQMTIDGHTDNTGKPEKNLQLSKDRAASVKAYFVSKGISADRLTDNGYGDTKPAASNKTAAGRAKNRRVAMDLKLKD